MGDIFESIRQDLWTLRLRGYGWKTFLRHHLPDPGPRDSFFLAGAFFFGVAFLAGALFFGVAFLAICAPFAGENYPIAGENYPRPSNVRRSIGSWELSREGKIDVVLVWAFDRFTPPTSHVVATLEDFQALGVDFDSYTQQIDKTTHASMLTFVLAAIRRVRVCNHRQQIKSGVAAAKARDKLVGTDVSPCEWTPRSAELDFRQEVLS